MEIPYSKTQTDRYRAIHIHTDRKFIIGSKNFECINFNNTIIIIGQEGAYEGYYKDSALYYNSLPRDLSAVIKLCNTADLVVLYGLAFEHCYIANRLQKSVKVIWRFFGSELYRKIPDSVYSNSTKAVFKKTRKRNSLELLINYFQTKIKHFAKYQTTPELEFTKAINRVDCFLGLFELEYRFLQNRWSSLPIFIQHPFISPNKKANVTNKQGNYIILGNSRNAFNNHLDILDIIKKSRARKNYSFLLLFSYGGKNLYSNVVREKACEINEIKIVEDFLSRESFNDLYATASAFVMNGYRQMAMGNILEAIRNGVKIYLNNRNITLSWLKEEGFKVFTIEDFVSDMEANNVLLTEAEAQHNLECLRNLSNKYNITCFHYALCNLFKRETL